LWLFLNLLVGEGDCHCVDLVILALTAKEKKCTHPRVLCWTQFQKDGLWGWVLKNFSLFSRQKHVQWHHHQWLGLFLAAWFVFVGLIDRLLPVEDLTACATLVLWLKWSASTCFVWSGFASTCFVWKQVGFCLNPQLIAFFQAKSNGCF